MITGNFYEDNQDIQFLINHVTDWQTIIPLRERGYRDAKAYQQNKDERFAYAPNSPEDGLENYKAILSQYGEISGRELAPVAATIDKKGLKYDKGKVFFPEEMQKVIGLLIDSQLLGYTVGREYGGWNLPFAARVAIMEMLSRGDSSTALTVGCYTLADVIEMFADDKIKQDYLPKMTAGQICGAMSLTEPDFGSDLPHLKTRAERQPDGSYLLSGNKRFITHACGFAQYPSAILTLARSSGEGAKGLSFFLVETKDIEVTRIEEKLGLHCSPTCEIVYDKSKALLIGEEGKGLVKYAMEMMNGARLAIGMQSVGVSEAALQEALKYASERVQFGSPIQDIPAVASILSQMKAITQAERALVYRSAEIVDLFEGYANRLHDQGVEEKLIRKDESVQKWDKLARLLTPTTKMFCSEAANKVAYDGLQIFGGSGFTEEFDAARFYRDARILTIYEGTTQLQVLAIIGGVIDLVRESSILRDFLFEEIAAAKNPEIETKLKKTLDYLMNMVKIYKELEKNIKETVSYEVCNSFAHVYCSILLARQLAIAKEKAPDYATVKEAAFKEFYRLTLAQLSKSMTLIKGDI